jgi:hypothetical protein
MMIAVIDIHEGFRGEAPERFSEKFQVDAV